MVSVFLYIPYITPVLPCFPYMVMLPNHLDVTSIVLDRALLWAAMGIALWRGPLFCRQSDRTVIVPWNTRGPERELRLFVGFQSNWLYISI